MQSRDLTPEITAKEGKAMSYMSEILNDLFKKNESLLETKKEV